MAKKQASTAKRQDSTDVPVSDGIVRPMTRAERNVLAKALAAGCDTDDAQSFLYSALDALSLDVWLAGVAYRNVTPAGQENFHSTLIAISERAAALRDFVTEQFDVNFTPLDEGGAS